MAGKEMLDNINKHLNFELLSAYAYMGMATYLKNKSWDGFSHFMEKQYQEEYMHFMKFYGFLSEVGHKIELEELPKPKTEYNSILEVFQAALKHEQAVTKRIHQLYEQSLNEKAYEVTHFLGWFLDEQVEEEANMVKIIEILENINGNYQGLYLLDKELGQRQ